MPSRHLAVQDTCVGCHMVLNPKMHNSSHGLANDTHRFSIEDADRPALCANCHGADVNGNAQVAIVASGLAAIKAKMEADMLATLNSWGATVIKISATDNAAGSAFTAVSFQPGTGSRPPGMSFKLYYSGTNKTVNMSAITLTDNTKLFPNSSNMMKAIWNYGIIFIGGSGGKAIHNPSFEQAVLANTAAADLRGLMP